MSGGPTPQMQRTHNAYLTNTSPSSYVPSNLNPNRQSRTVSRDTGYNGSEGNINDSDTESLFDQDTNYTSPSRAVSPPASRPAFGARVWSSISNAQPAAAALGRKGSVLHSRARSLAAYVPKLNGSNTSTTSLERVQAPNKIFGDLFNGESAPIRLGAPVSPTKEKEETEFVMEYTPTFTERPGSMFRRRETMESTRSTPPQQASRKSSWFARKPSTTSIPTPTRPQSHDPLANLNINLSLFPNGPADPLNPAAFNDLLLNATNLLQRMQTAYKEKADFIASLQPEMDAQREEVEESETRSQHLKMQLEDLSRQAQEREKTMQDLAIQLAEEKMRVQELRENAARSVRLVRKDSIDGGEEENNTPIRRFKRTSNGSASDSGFESDMESVFSAQSSANGFDTPISLPSRSLVNDDKRVWSGQTIQARDDVPSLSRQMSSSTVTTKSSIHQATVRGAADGPAWATVEGLRAENLELKVRIEEMQQGLQGCIDFVGLLDGVV